MLCVPRFTSCAVLCRFLATFGESVAYRVLCHLFCDAYGYALRAYRSVRCADERASQRNATALSPRRSKLNATRGANAAFSARSKAVCTHLRLTACCVQTRFASRNYLTVSGIYIEGQRCSILDRTKCAFRTHARGARSCTANKIYPACSSVIPYLC